MIFKNSLANFLAQLVFPLLSILLVPFYIKYLGLQGYGLVGFFSMLVTLLGIFTKGMGSALQREFARRDGSADSRSTMRQLLYTFEIIYWAIGLIIGISMIAFSGLVSTEWIKVETISPETIRACLILISGSIALTFPSSIYQSVFIGTQKQVMGNIINVGFAIAQAVIGAVVVYVWRSVLGFYIVGVIMAVTQMAVTRYWAFRALPAATMAKPIGFDLSIVKSMWKISADLMWTHGVGLIVSQLDRVAITNFLSVSYLGIYNAGVAGGRLLDTFYAPFFSATYPKLCQLAEDHDWVTFNQQIMRNTKVMMFICMTIGMPMAFFSPEILTIWTQNSDVVRGGAGVMFIYVFGYIFISYASVFYQGLIALGKTRYSVWFINVALLWYPITMWLLVGKWGIIGASWAWALYAIAAWLMNLVVTFRVVLKGTSFGVYVSTLFLTTLASVSLILIARHFADVYFNNFIWGRVLFAGMGSLTIAVACYLICFGFGVPDELREIFRK